MEDFLLRPIGERILAIGKSQIQEMAYAELAGESGNIIATVDADGNDGWEVISVSPPLEKSLVDLFDVFGPDPLNGDLAVQAAGAGIFLIALEADNLLAESMSTAEAAMFETRDKRVRVRPWAE